MSVLPNRKAFSDYITRIFLKYRKQGFDAEDEDADMCTKQGQSTSQELLGYQKLVREYLLIETPYRGILVYHGLGSGKTCSAIGVAESLLSNRKIFVLLPASLQDNFRQQLRKCGDPLYISNNHWEIRNVRSEADKAPALALGISDAFLRTQARYFVTVPDRPPNFTTFPLDMRNSIELQITDMIDSRYTFINYNGLNTERVKLLVPEEDPSTSKTFENSVVIIDEAHNLISRVINKSDIARRVYDAIYFAKNCKVVALSGTPVINRPNEVALFLNLLRGPIERIIIPVRDIEKWDELAMNKFFKAMPDVDGVEYNSMKRIIFITRNPPNFKSVYNEKGERIAVQYVKELERLTNQAWVETIRPQIKAVLGAELVPSDKISREILECLPTGFEEFINLFIDGLDMKNALLFQKRIQGLVSYYKGADERMLPKRINDENMLQLVPMSDEQFNRYLEVRWKEIQMESRARMRGPSALNEDFTSARVLSRLACNYAVPSEFKDLVKEQTAEDEKVDKSKILQKLIDEPDKYLREAGLAIFAPKMRKAFLTLKESVGEANFRNQFVYSQYRELEGLGIFGAILEANGFQRYKLTQEGGAYREDPAMDPAKPAFAFYTGEEDRDLREIMRYIFNEDWKGLDTEYPKHSQTIRESVIRRGNTKILCVLMATSTGAEGINLMNVRHIHILEPYWNPARHDQVIGRGIRLCSHASRQKLEDGNIIKEPVPLEDRTIEISFYVTVFSEAQMSSTTGFNIVPIRRADTRPKRYNTPDVPGARPPEAFMSSDEFLYEMSYEKSRITAGIARLLKQAAVDCEIHRKLHSKEQPVIQCMRFDSTVKGEELAYHSSLKDDELDVTYLRNQTKRKRRLQRIKVKDFLFLLDPDTRDIFDNTAFEDAERLLWLGTLKKDRIDFFNLYTTALSN
jgi:hypothetical protein